MIILPVLVVGWTGEPLKIVEGKINALLMGRGRKERVLLLGAETSEGAEEILGQSQELLAAAVIGRGQNKRPMVDFALQLRQQKGYEFFIIGVGSDFRTQFLQEGKVDLVCDPDELPVNLIFHLRENNLVHDPPSTTSP